MTKITVNSEMMAKLDGLHDVLELCDELGQTLGYFHPFVKTDGTSEKIASPLSLKEVERRKKNRSGRQLEDILDDLQTS